jgi:hypothetical protein
MIFLVLFINFELKVETIPTSFISDKFLHVEKADSLLYFTTGRGLVLYKMNGSNIDYLSRFATDGIALALKVSGNYAYIADHYNGLCIVDISNPKSPKQVGSYKTNGKACNITIKDKFAFIADGENGFVILDITNPIKPFIIGHCPNIGYSISVTVNDTFAYIGAFNSPMKIINIANPSNPYVVGKFPFDTLSYGVDVFIDDTIAYINCGFLSKTMKPIYFAVVNVRNPVNPTIIAQLSLPPTNTGIMKWGNYIYTNAQDSGVYIIDVKNPQNPIIIGRYKDTYWFGNNFIVDSILLIVPKVFNGFSVVDIRDPQRPINVYQYKNANWQSFAFEDDLNYLYMVGQIMENGRYFNKSLVKILDINNPINPISCSELYFSNNSSLYEGSVFFPYLALTLRKGYPNNETLSTAILDVSNPYAPKIIKTVQGGGVNELHFPYLYILEGNKIKITDINKSNLWLDSIVLPSEGYDMEIVDTVIYITTQNSLEVFNLKSHLQLGKCYHGKAYAINISLDYPYLAIPYTPYSGSTYGFLIFDIKNPSLPKLLIDTVLYAPPINPQCICIMGCELKNNYLYLGRGNYGFDIWKFNPPYSIHKLTTKETPYLATHSWPSGNSNIHIKKNVIYLLDEGSLECYQLINNCQK